MRTATLIKADLPRFTGAASLYRLDPPLVDYDEKTAAEYVIVSAAVVMFTGPETYIFAATPEGEVESWGEMKGSMRGTLDHADALREAGYEIVTGPEGVAS